MMGTRTLRGPSFDTSKDLQACTLMSCGQLLYMHGLIPRANIRTMNALIGRKPYETTQDGDIARLMYGAGFHELAFEALDVAKAIEDFDYWYADILENYNEEGSPSELRETWELWREFGQTSLKLREEFPEHITIVPRLATLSDLDTVLEDGRHAITCVESLPYGHAVFGLTLGGNAQDGYDLYHPELGAMHQSAAALAPRGTLEFSALKLRDGVHGTPVTLPA